jgi:hypothetical protein
VAAFKLATLPQKVKVAAVEKQLPLTKAAIKNGHLSGNVATVVKKQLPLKKAAAIEKSGHQKQPSKVATFEAMWLVLNWPHCLRGQSGRR